MSCVVVRLNAHPIAVPQFLPYGSAMVSLSYADVQ